jgi:hypothetical protein
MTNPSIGMLAVGTHGSATAQVGQALRYPFRYAGTLGALGDLGSSVAFYGCCKEGELYLVCIPSSKLT